MSLTLLPAVDVRDGKAVRLRQGESGSETDYGSPLEAARTWVEAGAEWIHLVDLDAAFGIPGRFAVADDQQTGGGGNRHAAIIAAPDAFSESENSFAHTAEGACNTCTARA